MQIQKFITIETIPNKEKLASLMYNETIILITRIRNE